MDFPAALVALLGLVSGPRSSIRCTVQLAAAIFRIITERRVFVVQGWRGDMAAGLEWSEPIGIMMTWRRSLAAGRVLDKWASTPPESVTMTHEDPAAEMAAIKQAIAPGDPAAPEAYCGLNPALQRTRILNPPAPEAADPRPRSRRAGRGARRGCGPSCTGRDAGKTARECDGA